MAVITSPSTAPPSVVHVASASSALHAALSAVPKLLIERPHLQPAFHLPSFVRQRLSVSPSISLPLLPTPVFHLAGNITQVYHFQPPHLTSLLPAYERERDALSHTCSSLPVTPVTLLTSRVASYMRSRSSHASLVLIHSSSSPVELPKLPFAVHFCTPSQLSLVNHKPHYRPSPDAAPIPIVLASLELSVRHVSHLPLDQRDVIVALATQNMLLADISLAALAEDALVLRFLRAHLGQLQLSPQARSVVRAVVAPTLPVAQLSESVLSLCVSEMFVVRPRFWLDEQHTADACATFSDAQSLLTAVSAEMRPVECVLHALQARTVPRAVQLALVADGVFCGVASFGCHPSWRPMLDTPAAVDEDTAYSVHPPKPDVHSTLFVSELPLLCADDVLRVLSRQRSLFVALPNAPTAKSFAQYVCERLKARSVRVEARQFGAGNPASLTAGRYGDACSFRTFASDKRQPPRLVALVNNENAVGTHVFAYQLLSVRDVVNALDEHTRRVLRTVAVEWGVKGRVGHDGNEPVLSPLLMSSSRARFDVERMSIEHLSGDQLLEFNAAFNALCKQIRVASIAGNMSIAAPGVFMFDNHAFLHSVHPVLYGAPHATVDQVTFDLPFVPELYRSLEAASRHPLFDKFFSYCEPGTKDKIRAQPFHFENWPAMTKAQYVQSVDGIFAKHFYGKGSMYWAASGGSTSPSSTTRVAVPTASPEMQKMRTNFRELCVDRGLFNSHTVAVNLLTSYNLSTSMEVQRTLLRGAGATHLGIGPNLSDEKVCDIIERYGADLLIGGGSHIIQLTIYCLRNNRRLPTVKRIAHGGENFGATVAKCFSMVWHEDVGVYGMYGSAEAGVFALKRPDQEFYETMADSIHLEIVDDDGNEVPTGQVGTIVVTNLLREILPQVRYYTGDLAHFVCEERSKFELLGRNLKSVRHQFGCKIVSWDEVEDCVRQALEQYFGGLCLYQVWIPKHRLGEFKLTLAVYANSISETVEAAFSKEAVRSLWKLFSTGTNVSGICVKMVQRSEEMSRHMFSNKLHYFVVHQ